MQPQRAQPLDYHPAQPRFRMLRRVAMPLLVVLVLAGSWMGTSKFREMRRQQAITIIEQNGGLVVRNGDGMIERVHLAAPGVGDAEFEKIAQLLPYLRGLKQLDLIGPRFTDTGLQSLTDLDRVKDLYIFNTSASAEGIDELKRRFPHLNVHEVAPNFPASKLVSRDVYPHAVTALAFLPNGDLLTGSGDGYLRLWPAAGTTPSREVRAHQDWVFSIALSPDGATLATGGGDDLVRLWDAATLRDKGELRGHTDDVHAVVFHPGGASLFSAGDDRTIRAWDARTLRTLNVIRGHEAPIPALAISPGGPRLASASRDGTARLWNAETGTLLHMLEHEDDVTSIRFSPDARTVATASYDKTIRLWSAQGGRHIRTFTGHADWIFNVAFSPDGASLLSAGRDRSVRIWDVRSGSMTGTLADDRMVSMILFDNDGRTFASAAADGSVLTRDWRGWTVRRTLLPAFEPLSCSR